MLCMTAVNSERSESSSTTSQPVRDNISIKVFEDSSDATSPVQEFFVMSTRQLSIVSRQETTHLLDFWYVVAPLCGAVCLEQSDGAVTFPR